MDMLSNIRDILSFVTPVVDAGLGALAITIAVKVRAGYEDYKQLTNTFMDKLTAMDKRVTTLEMKRAHLSAVAGVV